MASEIPTEVLELFIGSLLRDEAIRAGHVASNILRVCHRWHDVSARLLRKDIAIRSPAHLYRLTAVTHSRNLALVKSFTLNLSPVQPQRFAQPGSAWQEPIEDKDYMILYGNNDTRKLWAGMEALPKILSQMTNLSNFSFYIQGQNYGTPPKGFWLRHDDIFNIASSLPSSITHLEIDTKAQERTKSADLESDICEAIARHMPHLETLRLRLNRFCKMLFVPSDTLRTCVITTITPNRLTEAKHCGEKDYEDRPPLWHRLQVGQRQRLILTTGAMKMLKVAPKLEKMFIVDVQKGEGDSFEMINVRDVKAKQTTSSPIRPLHMSGERAAYVQLRILKMGAVEDVVGNIGDIEEFAEGMTWRTTKSGSRFPAVFQELAEGRSHEWKTPPTWRGEVPGTISGSKKWISMTQAERAAGKLLITPRVTDGLGEVEPLVAQKSKYDVQPTVASSSSDDDFDLNRVDI